MTRFGLAQHIIDKMVSVLRDHPAVEKALIFGSRADGTFKPQSDIDLAVFAPRMGASEFARLRFELRELPIVFKIDVVHVDTLENEALSDKILAQGRELYPRQSE